MATTYSIRDWEKHFECSQSKRAERLSWVATPNKHDGKSYRRLIQMKNGAALYGAWILIVQVASKCPVRGVLADDDGPLNADDIADKTLTDPKLIQSALDACCSKAIGWIVKDEAHSERDTSRSITIDDGVPTGQDITEQDKTGRDSIHVVEPTLPDIAIAWNSIPGVIHVRDMTKARKAALKLRLADQLWAEKFEEGIERVIRSRFCRGGGDSGWKADFDWFLRPDTLTKILEGKYDDRPGTGITRHGGSSSGAPNLLEREQRREQQQLDILQKFVEGDSGG